MLAEYSALREHAKLLSNSRTKLFEEAANAYVRCVMVFPYYVYRPNELTYFTFALQLHDSGSKDVARALSQQAHSLSEQMHTCQLEVCSLTCLLLIESVY